MSHFYGTLKGIRGEASRCGSKGSGIVTHAASWKGAIRVEVYHDEKTGRDKFRVDETQWHGHGVSRLLAQGDLGDHTADRKRKLAAIKRLETRSVPREWGTREGDPANAPAV